MTIVILDHSLGNHININHRNVSPFVPNEYVEKLDATKQVFHGMQRQEEAGTAWTYNCVP